MQSKSPQPDENQDRGRFVRLSFVNLAKKNWYSSQKVVRVPFSDCEKLISENLSESVGLLR